MYQNNTLLTGKNLMHLAILILFQLHPFRTNAQTAGAASSSPTTKPATAQHDIDYWITTGDQSALLAKQTAKLSFRKAANKNNSIVVDPKQIFQTIDGFGYTLTGGSASLINQLPKADKEALLKELFTTKGNGIGISYLRITVGASDMSASVFTYDDMPAGQTDVNLSHFSLGKDLTDLVPLLQQIVALQPNIKILASPWTAPVWMKSNGSSIGGSLLTANYAVYANYLVKYIQAMQAKGIRIDAITPQNEPLNPKNNPSMVMQATEQAEFVKNNLGPAFASAGITTKIILYDHNCDVPDYPISILNDAAARKYVDGSAFHMYGGDISALSTVHDAYPDKNLYFTEQWVGGPGDFPGDFSWHVKTLVIGATRYWSKNVLEWNLAADENYQPHTDGGCTRCLGALTISNTVKRNVAYYIIAHASKFVPAGSVRISSNIIGKLHNVAFKTPEGKKVLIVLNDDSTAQNFNIVFNGKMATTSLAAGAVATYVWK